MSLHWTYRHARRLVITIIGVTVILFGVALLVLPGPGTVVIVLGVAILATEWVWARRLLKRLKEEGESASRTLGEFLGFRRRDRNKAARPESKPGGDRNDGDRARGD